MVALRDYRAASLDEAESKHDSAALTTRMMEAMEAIDALPDPEADAPAGCGEEEAGGLAQSYLSS